MIELTLPWPPAGLSPNARSHWAVLGKAKKQYRHACAMTAIEQGLKPSQTEKLHLSLTFYPPTHRTFDLDNCLARMKSGLDGLADVLKVDDKHWALSIQKSGQIGGYVKVKIEEKEQT